MPKVNAEQKPSAFVPITKAAKGGTAGQGRAEDPDPTASLSPQLLQPPSPLTNDSRNTFNKVLQELVSVRMGIEGGG